jgi:uncharacterized protein YoxC
MTLVEALGVVALAVAIVLGVALIALALRLWRVAGQAESTAEEARRTLAALRSLLEQEVRPLLQRAGQQSDRVDKLIQQMDVVSRVARGADEASRQMKEQWRAVRAAGVGLAAGLRTILSGRRKEEVESGE